MQFNAKTISLEGVKAKPVIVQCQVSRGPHSMQIVGLPGPAIREAKERIIAAFYAHSLSLPPTRITFNLSPAGVPKAGSHYDLPMAIALLANMELLPRRAMEEAWSLGELSLDGHLEPVEGVLAAGLCADKNHETLICPPFNASEAHLVKTLKILTPHRLIDLIKHYRGRPIETKTDKLPPSPLTLKRDFAEVKGMHKQKRALEIAAAGRHHFFMVGPPGAGKSLLASALPSIMPPIEPSEFLDSTLIHSAAGLLKDEPLIMQRPYYDPHHTASAAAIVGGGRDAKPGAISLAHNGILFLDELPEFKRDVLESLRQPLESGEVLISRANAHVHYPAKFLLVAAANPCPCGWMYDATKWCNRAPECGERYMERISGPLLDRFSLRSFVEPLTLEELQSETHAEPSHMIRERVTRARKRAYERNGAGISNEDLNTPTLDAALDQSNFETQKLAHMAMDRLALSTRGYYRMIKTALTICDLDAKSTLEEDHIAEAVTFRVLEHDKATFDSRSATKRLGLSG